MGLLDGDSDNYLDDILSGLKMSEAHKRNIEKLKKRLRLPDDDAIFFYLAAVEYTVQLCDGILAGIKLEHVEIEQLLQQIRAEHPRLAEEISRILGSVAKQTAADIQKIGMAATSAIAEANASALQQSQEILKEARELKTEIIALRASVEQDRQTNIEVSNAVLGQIGQSNGSLDTAVTKINQTHTDLTRLQRNTTWIKFTEWFSPLAALVIVLLVGVGSGGWVMWAKDNDSIKAMSAKYNDSVNVLGRNLVNWNVDRIIKCKNDNNSKCTLWLKNPP